MNRTQRNKKINWTMTLPAMRKTQKISPRSKADSRGAIISQRTIVSDRRDVALDERLQNLQTKHADKISLQKTQKTSPVRTIFPALLLNEPSQASFKVIESSIQPKFASKTITEINDFAGRNVSNLKEKTSFSKNQFLKADFSKTRTLSKA